MKNTIKLFILTLFCLRVIISFGQEKKYNPEEHLSHSPMQKAFNYLYQYVEQDKENYSILYEDMNHYWYSNTNERVLINTPNNEGLIFIIHIGWSVSVSYHSNNLEVKDVKHFTAKEGFSISPTYVLKLILHKHPGTGMSVDDERIINVENKKLVIE
jgi:hypothetical protein